jgi:excisionase family DNA binding protein
MTTQTLLRAADVAEILAVSVKTIYRLAEMGQLPCIRLSPGCVRFDPADVEVFIESARERWDAAGPPRGPRVGALGTRPASSGLRGRSS